MTKKDVLKARVDFFKFLTNTIVAVMLAIAGYIYAQPGGINSKIIVPLLIIAMALTFYFSIYKSYLKDLEGLEDTLNVKLDVNLNDDIILKKDEKFKIIFEKDDKGNLMIKKG
ncbi:MAG: hypothetical protein WCE94_02405 [Candidatus Methanoperedens sp.]